MWINHRKRYLPWTKIYKDRRDYKDLWVESVFANVIILYLMNTVSIQPASRGDLATIIALAQLIWRRHYPGIISMAQIDYMLTQRYSEAVMLEQVEQPGRWLDKLLLGDETIGFANYLLTETSGEMKLDRLYLHPDLHGKGYGAHLVAHCEQAARDAGCQRLVLAVNRDNRSSIAFYEKMGFHIATASYTDIGGGFVMDDYIMAKAL